MTARGHLVAGAAFALGRTRPSGSARLARPERTNGADQNQPAAVDVPPAAKRGRVPQWLGLGVVARAVLLVLSVSFLLVLHGQLPGFVSSEPPWYTALGSIECGSLSISDLARAECPLTGGTAGGSVANGIVYVASGAVIERLLGLSPEWSNAATASIFMTLALLGGYGFARRFNLVPLAAYLVTLAYLSSISLLGLHGFGSTFWGIAMIPAAIWVGLVASSRVTRGVITRSSMALRLATVAGWGASMLVLLTLDGYAFVMTQFAVGVFLGLELLFSLRKSWSLRLRAAAGLLSFGGALLLAYAAYRHLVAGAGDWGRSNIGLFRSMGADVVTMVVPPGSVWWSRFVPHVVDFGQLWGDGSNSGSNYLGLVLVLLAVVGAVGGRRKGSVVAIAAVAMLALFLSLGPSLKFDEIRGPLAVPVTYQSYLMPVDAGLVRLPTEWAYEHVPGLMLMRATYRWISLAKLAIFVLAGLGAQSLFRSSASTRQRIAIGTLCCLAIVEVSPDVPTEIAQNRGRADQVAAFNRDVLQPMEAAIPQNTTVVFAPNAVGENDFLVNYLAPMLHVNTYNVGGDKALAIAEGEWPGPVSTLILSDDDFASNAFDVLHSGFAGMIVVPYFDLRWSSYAWPGDPTFGDRGRAAAAEAAEDPRLQVITFDTFALVTSVG